MKMNENIMISVKLNLKESAKFNRIRGKLGVKHTSEVVRHLLAQYVEED